MPFPDLRTMLQKGVVLEPRAPPPLPQLFRVFSGVVPLTIWTPEMSCSTSSIKGQMMCRRLLVLVPEVICISYFCIFLFLSANFCTFDKRLFRKLMSLSIVLKVHLAHQLVEKGPQAAMTRVMTLRVKDLSPKRGLSRSTLFLQPRGPKVATGLLRAEFFRPTSQLRTSCLEEDFR